MNTKDMIVGAQILGTQSNGGGGSVIVPTINATATTLAAGSDATVTKTGSNTNVTFNFGIPQGVQGNQGPTGPPGPAGQGVPTGGTTGQVLVKNSDTDYDTSWADQTGGGGTTYTPGDGIAILGQTISVKLSGQANNAASFASDGGIFVQDTPEYSAGDGVQISGSTIQANISTASDNATGILNGAIYTPATFQTTVMPMISVSTVPATPDVQVTATKGDLSVSGTTGADGKVELEVTAFGVWKVSGTLNEKQLSETVVVSNIQTYTAQLTAVNVFGVSWDTTNPSTQLTRLTPETDPNGVVTLSVSTEPQPAVGTGTGSSPFDSFMPWSGMEQYNIIDGAVSYKRGEPGFSQTNYDTVVYIPKTYYRIAMNGSNMLFYVGDDQFQGSQLHPGSDRYIDRYNVNANLNSISGQPPLVSITLSNARANAASKGNGWSIYDYSTYMVICLLYLVEFADWDCRNIGNGVFDTSGPIDSGATDIMNYHTGALEAIGSSAVQYRNIENLWGNVWELMDGVLIYNQNLYACSDISKYSNTIGDGYSNEGMVPVGQYPYVPASFIKLMQIGTNNTWVVLPTQAGGTSSTYISAPMVAQASGTQAPIFGGGFFETNGAWVSIFTIYGNLSPNETSEANNVSQRLVFRSEVTE